ncbi:MAG: dienelactone hydrolase family protein [Candidatus Limnocylindrales bacterium]
MCFDLDSHPPIVPIAGGALDHEDLTLRAADGTAFAAFRARAARPSGAGVLILPDVRGLYSFYEELALRFAEAGIDALAIDYFGRTAGAAKRDAEFSYVEHVQQTKLPELRADVTAGVAELQRDGRVTTIFTIGFCFGGRLSYSAGTFGLDLAGTIAFYGMPLTDRPGYPAPISVAPAMASPILGMFGGADQAIPPEAIDEFEAALAAAGVEHELVTYADAPHSFFDRKAADFGEAAADSWRRSLEFIRARTPAA